MSNNAVRGGGNNRISVQPAFRIQPATGPGAINRINGGRPMATPEARRVIRRVPPISFSHGVSIHAWLRPSLHSAGGGHGAPSIQLSAERSWFAPLLHIGMTSGSISASSSRPWRADTRRITRFTAASSSAISHKPLQSSRKRRDCRLSISSVPNPPRPKMPSSSADRKAQSSRWPMWSRNAVARGGIRLVHRLITAGTPAHFRATRAGGSWRSSWSARTLASSAE